MLASLVVTPSWLFLTLGRRPLDDVPENGKAAAAQVVTPTAFNAEERMEVIRGATSMPEILRAMLRRSAYFKGATSVHDCIDVHRTALRAAATLMRKVWLTMSWV